MVCSFCGDRAVVVWLEGPDFRNAVDSAEKVRSDETYQACATCFALVEANDRDALAARELVRQRRKGGEKRGVSEQDVVESKRRILEKTFWAARSPSSRADRQPSYQLDDRWARRDADGWQDVLVNDFFLSDPDGRQISLGDPSGGTFDGAGGFPTSRSETPILRSHDPYGETIIDSEAARGLLPEIQWLLENVGDSKSSGQWEQARPGVARRGLLRLQRMVEYCVEHPGSYIGCIGGEG